MESRFEKDKGVALILAFVIMVGLSGVLAAFLATVSYETRGVSGGLRNMQAFYIAEAGRAKARRALTTGGQAIGWGEEDISFGEGTYTVTTADNGDNTYTITSDGYIPNDTNPTAQRRVVERSIPITIIPPPNLSLDATASASSELWQFTADKANDGTVLTKWQSSGGDGSWLAIDFGSTATFDKIIFKEACGLGGFKIEEYQIQNSDNGTDWDEVANVEESIETGPLGFTKTYTVTFDSVSAQYVRLYLVNTGWFPSIREFESYDIVGGGSTTFGQGTFVTSW